MKVWGLTYWHPECPPSANGSQQTRTIVAATSRTAAARAIGISPNHMKEYGSETGNAKEVETAMTEPGTVFWKPQNSYDAEYTRA